MNDLLFYSIVAIIVRIFFFRGIHLLVDKLFKIIVEINRRLFKQLGRIWRSINNLLKIVLVFYCFTFFTNCNTDVKTSEKLKKFNIQTVAVDMQSKIDSATVLYDLAIRDKMENVSDSIILKKYSNQIILLEKEAQEILVTANNAGKRGEISQQDYDELINLVLMDSIQCKIHTLERLGLKFQ